MFFTRRGFLGSLAGASFCSGADKGPLFPSEVQRFADAATELPIFRLTDPSHQSWLPAYYGRAVSRRSNFLLYSCDRTGSTQAYQLDLKSGQSRGLTDASQLVTESLTLTPDERSFCHIDGGVLFLTGLSNLRPREVYRTGGGFELGHGFSLAEDGLYAVLAEQKTTASRLQLINMRTGGAETIAESSEPISDPSPRPRRAGVLYRRADTELWVVNYDGAQNRKLRLAPGGLGPAVWGSDGRSLFYLNYPSDRKQLHNIREFTPDTNEDQFVSNTTQFVDFNRNSDSSVFVGASGSKASPYLLLLVRSVKRELTLCEHRASDPRMVAPIFAPNSQRVFFQSDRDGKIALYAMVVDRLVAETETAER